MLNFIKKNRYTIIPIILLFVFQLSVYYFSKMINKNMLHHDFTLEFDRMVPLLTIFIVPYILSYVWWLVSPMLIANYLGKKAFYNYIFASVITYFICFLFYIILPTTIIRPNIENNSIFDILTNFIYTTDVPNNLFPSMHCLISWLLFVGIRNKNVPKKIVVTQGIIAIMINLSTQFVKQHYIVDLILSILLAEIVFLILRKTKITSSIIEKLHI